MSIVKYLFLPPAAQVFLLLISLYFLYCGRRLIGIFLILVTALSLWALGLPVVSYQLQRSLEVYPAVNLNSVDAQAIVILGGGRAFDGAEFGWLDAPSEQTLSRLNYGAFLHRQTGLPVLVSGGRVHNELLSEAELMNVVLVASFGIESDWIEDQSRNTFENAIYSAEMLKNSQVERVLLVSQAWHLHRAVPAFEQQGLTVYPAPIQFTTPPPKGVLAWIPRAYYFRQSTQMLHEWLGYFAYQIRMGT